MVAAAGDGLQRDYFLFVCVCAPSSATATIFSSPTSNFYYADALMNFILIFEAYTRWRDNDWWLIIFINFYRFIGPLHVKSYLSPILLESNLRAKWWNNQTQM